MTTKAHALQPAAMLRQTLLTLSAVCITVTLAGCSSGTSRYDTGPIMERNEGINAKDYWRTTEFEVVDLPDGAMPEVPAELGGDGFEAVAEELGFTTNTNLRSMADPRGVPGGMLRVPIADFPATMRSEGKDSNTTFMALVSGMMYESLTSTDAYTDAFAPSLASHWKIEVDEAAGTQTFTFRINPEARWQTGHRITAEDVLASWTLQTDDGLHSPYSAMLFRKFSEPEILSPYMIRTSSPELNWRHFMYFGGMTIYPAHIIGDMTGKQYMETFQNKTMPGSGSYLLREEDIRQGNSLTMTRINNYWDRNNPIGQGGANFYKVKFVVVADPTLQRERFKKGELDVYIVGQAKYWVKEFLPEEIEQLGKGWIQRKKIFTNNPQGITGFVFNMREAPFSDIRVRRAFCYLFNREKLIDKLFYNEYLPMNSYYPSSVYENPEDEIITYQPERALELLAQAGYDRKDDEGYLINHDGERITLELMIDESPTWERIMTVIQEDYRQAGIDMKLKHTNGSIQFQMVMERKFKMHFQSWGGLYFPNPESSFSSAMADQENSNNLAGFKSAALDSICQVYDVTFDPAERVKQIQAIDKILTESYQYALAWYGPFTRLGYWNKFGMPEWGLSRTGDWRSIIGLWWYDADKHRALVDAIKKDGSLPIEPVEIDYWRNYQVQH